jgi:hypothetical protein
MPAEKQPPKAKSNRTHRRSNYSGETLPRHQQARTVLELMTALEAYPKEMPVGNVTHGVALTAFNVGLEGECLGLEEFDPDFHEEG